MSAVIGADAAESPTFQEDLATLADLEHSLVELLAGVLKSDPDSISVDSHFFDELGADSLVMAHFCARVRKQSKLPSVSMRDIYRYPTISDLAKSLAPAAEVSHSSPTLEVVEEPAARTSAVEHAMCAVMQALSFFGYAWLAMFAIGEAYAWSSAGTTVFEIYQRLVAVGVVGFFVMACVPVLAKWVLTGRAQPAQIRIWSLAYIRFWVVKTLLRVNPVMLFVGTPIYAIYLRALGAKIGPGAVIFSAPPVCADLLSVGAGTVIRRESMISCYRAMAGRIETGPVTLGKDVVVGERTVIDIDTAMGDGTQLGHNSSLHRGQSVPAGERWHGSPAQPTDVNYLRVAPAKCGSLRRVTFCAALLASLFLVYLPLLQAAMFLVSAFAPSLANVFTPAAANVGAGAFLALVVDGTLLSGILLFGSVLVGLLLMYTVPRILNLFITPDTVYPLYGFHDWAHRTIVRMTNVKFLLRLVGDSSLIVHYLLGLGYKLRPFRQSGSNFGIDVKHSNPYLCTIGIGTMVADGLTMVNEEVSSSSFCVSPVNIGKNNFIGNNIAYPAGARTGDNCLLATKVMVPLDGDERTDVGLLGSPSFEIPRTVERDAQLGDQWTDDEYRRGLSAKNRYNLRTIGLFFISTWIGVSVVVFLNLIAFEFYDMFAHALTGALVTLSILAGGFYVALVERCVTGFRSLRPTSCSIYDPYFWRHERVWKLPNDEYPRIFDGTPFKPLIWRLMGVRMGRRVFDDGGHISERTLTTIGDECVLNAGSAIQCHSQEDGAFKSDRTVLGDGCTVGVGAMVHYGVTMGDGCVVAADSFLMKGEEMPARARWGGNPAREMEVK